MSLLALPEIWIALGLFTVLGVTMLRHTPQEKKRHARLARVTRKPVIHAANGAESLRRRDPNEGSAIGQKLAEYNSIETLRNMLETAGMAITPQKLLAYVAAMALATFMIVTMVFGKSILFGILFAGVVSLGVPRMVIKRRLRKRQRAFLKLFPEALELMVRGLRAGLPVAESFQTVSQEIPTPVGDLFTTVTRQIQLGVPMEKALADAGKKIDLAEFNFFVTTIILQRETGGNLGEILSNLADMLRQRQMMKLKIGALSSEARASAYIVGALPFVVFAMLSIISPSYLDPLYNDYRGNMAVAIAGGMMLFGGLVMKRMTMLDI